MCESKFSSKQGLDQHVNTHTAAAPYPCRYCEKRFKQPSARCKLKIPCVRFCSMLTRMQ